MRLSALLIGLALLSSLAAAQETKEGFAAYFYPVDATLTLDKSALIEAQNYAAIDFIGADTAAMWAMPDSFPQEKVGAQFFGTFTPPCAASLRPLCSPLVADVL